MQSFADIADWVWEGCKEWTGASRYIADQLCRAIDSVGANICEGYGRGSPGQLRQFYGYAKGSGMEAAYWMDRAVSRRLIDVGNGKLQMRCLTQSLIDLDVIIERTPKK